MIVLSVVLLEPRFLSIMLPVSFYTFGIAFVTPQMTTAAMFPFPHIAGSASALMGFIQMGAGFAAGVVAAALGMPVVAFGIVIPIMGALSIAGYLWFLRASRVDLTG